MQSHFSGICLSLSCAIDSVCNSLFPLSVNERYTCLWKCTPCNFLSFSWLCTQTLSHTHTNSICRPTVSAPAPTRYTHTHTPKSKHVKTLVHAQLGDVKHQARVSQGRHFPRCFCLFGWAGGMSEASSGSGSPQSSTGLSNTKKVMEESCGDVCVCIPTETNKKNSSKGTHIWFLWFDKFLFAKKF